MNEYYYNRIDYSWFVAALAYFGEFKLTLTRIKPKHNKMSSESVQLKLLD